MECARGVTWGMICVRLVRDGFPQRIWGFSIGLSSLRSKYLKLLGLRLLQALRIVEP
jgi:hypothetical protein